MTCRVVKVASGGMSTRKSKDAGTRQGTRDKAVQQPVLHYSPAGDTYASIGKMLKVKESKLRAYNDVDRSYSLKQGDVVYLGKKRKRPIPP